MFLVLLESSGESVANPLVDQQQLLTGEGHRAMHTTEISAAIRPYSMAVTPDSSLKKRVTTFILSSSVKRALPRGAARCRERRDRLPRLPIIAGVS